ncbi:MAG: FAD-dependent oxidoreductase [Gammaproteobacteria bacterium]
MGNQIAKRFIIVGAGPAGIHMAYLLALHGIKNVTILEKSDHLGGKCLSLAFHNQLHEMGATYLHAGYGELFKLLKDLHIENNSSPIFSNEQYFFLDNSAHSVINGKNWLRQEVVKGNLLPSLQKLPKKLKTTRSLWSRLNLIIALIKYQFLHRKIFGKYSRDFLPKPDNNFLPLLSHSTHDFLVENGLQILLPFFKACYVSTGYGFLENSPALYALWFVSPVFLRQCFWGLIANKPIAYVLPEGYQAIWETIVKQYELNIRYNIDIKVIERDQPAAPVVIRGIDQVTGKETEWLADEIILTLPMKDSLSILKEPTQNELDAFSKQKASTFITSIISCTADKRLEHQRIVFPKNLNIDGPGHLLNLRNSEECTRLHNSDHHERLDLVALQYIDNENYNKSEIDVSLKEELTMMGLKDVAVGLQKEWSYFPHYDAEQILAGYPWKILDFQGQNHTWYGGSSTCFESVLSVVNYNNQLISMILPEEKQIK